MGSRPSMKSSALPCPWISTCPFVPWACCSVERSCGPGLNCLSVCHKAEGVARSQQPALAVPPQARAVRNRGPCPLVRLTPRATRSGREPLAAGLAQANLILRGAQTLSTLPLPYLSEIFFLLGFHDRSRAEERGTGPCFRPASLLPKHINRPKNGPVPDRGRERLPIFDVLFRPTCFCTTTPPSAVSGGVPGWA